MSWAKFSDTFPDHPKVLELSQDAFCAAVEGICYSARHLTDGVISHHALQSFRFAGKRPVKAAAALVAAGLWHETEGGYVIHDYLDYNPSRAAVLDRRSRDAARKQHGFRTDSTRNPDGIQTDSARIPSLARARRANGPGTTGIGSGVSEGESEREAPPAAQLWQAWVEASAAAGIPQPALCGPKQFQAVESVLALMPLADALRALREFWRTPHFDGKRQFGMFAANAGQLLAHARSGTAEPFGARPAQVHRLDALAEHNAAVAAAWVPR